VSAAAPSRVPPAAAEVPRPVVQLSGVRKAYDLGLPNESAVLHGIDLIVRHGESCAVVGPSGSDKSTRLNIVGLLDRPTAGTVEVCGEQTRLLDDGALTRLSGHGIGFVFRHRHRVTAFTALDSTEHGATVLFVTHDATLAGRCDRTIEVIDGRLVGP
jgi:lipoprotein-releasing system ATP-binding protein